MIQEYYTPSTIAEAVSLKRRFGKHIIYYAGGTHINYAPVKNEATKAIGLNRLGLTNIWQKSGVVTIESGVTLQQIIDSPETPQTLKEACRMVITRNIRNIATIGGNVAANRPDSPIIPFLMTCGAQIELDGQRPIRIEEYIGKRDGEFIVQILLPKVAGTFSIKRVTHSANGLPVLTVAVKIESDRRSITGAIVVVSGLEERIRRLEEIEAELIKNQLSDPEGIERQVATLVQPTNDHIGSGAYKRYICGVTVVDCIRECLQQGEVL